MDDDDLRRGRPTVHRAFDEATAILAGDALLTLAFEILAAPATAADGGVRAALCAGLARASGLAGMVGGQMLDLAAERAAEPLDARGDRRAAGDEDRRAAAASASRPARMIAGAPAPARARAEALRRRARRGVPDRRRPARRRGRRGDAGQTRRQGRRAQQGDLRRRARASGRPRAARRAGRRGDRGGRRDRAGRGGRRAARGGAVRRGQAELERDPFKSKRVGRDDGAPTAAAAHRGCRHLPTTG